LRRGGKKGVTLASEVPVLWDWKGEKKPICHAYAYMKGTEEGPRNERRGGALYAEEKRARDHYL